MAQVRPGRLRACLVEMRSDLTQKASSSTKESKNSPFVVNPAFDPSYDSFPEDNLEPIQMEFPRKVSRAKPEKVAKICQWDVKESSEKQQVSLALPWSALALIGITCLISVLALLLTLLMFFGEMEAKNCGCGDQNGKSFCSNLISRDFARSRLDRT